VKFLVNYRWEADSHKKKEGIGRFQKTGGQPPKGVKLLGRWTRVDGSGGVALVETDDPRALTEFSFMWNDLMELTTVPVLEDEQLADVFKRVAG
jgi:hypothetical protein